MFGEGVAILGEWGKREGIEGFNLYWIEWQWPLGFSETVINRVSPLLEIFFFKFKNLRSEKKRIRIENWKNGFNKKPLKNFKTRQQFNNDAHHVLEKNQIVTWHRARQKYILKKKKVLSILLFRFSNRITLRKIFWKEEPRKEIRTNIESIMGNTVSTNNKVSFTFHWFFTDFPVFMELLMKLLVYWGQSMFYLTARAAGLQWVSIMSWSCWAIEFWASIQ